MDFLLGLRSAKVPTSLPMGRCGWLSLIGRDRTFVVYKCWEKPYVERCEAFFMSGEGRVSEVLNI